MPENPKNPTPEEIYVSELNKEEERWNQLGISPENFMPKGGVLAVMIRIDVLTEMLEEAGMFDKEKLDEKTRKYTLQRLAEVRKELEPQVVAARRAAIVGGRLH